MKGSSSRVCGKLPIFNLINKTTHHHHDPSDYKNEDPYDYKYDDDIFDDHDDYMMKIILRNCKGGHLINMSGKCKEEKIRWDKPR